MSRTCHGLDNLKVNRPGTARLTNGLFTVTLDYGANVFPGNSSDITTSNGTNYLNVANPQGNVFFRLK